MTRSKFRALILILGLETLTGCAVVQSHAVGTTDNGAAAATPDGIPYFLPKRPFLITVAMPPNGTVPTITVANGPAQPDLDPKDNAKFVLQPGINLLANNEFNVSVAPNGLLKTSVSTATSQVATAVQAAATTAASFAVPGLGVLNLHNPAFAALPLHSGTPASLSQSGGAYACPSQNTTYQLLVYPEDTQPVSICDANDAFSFSVTWTRGDGKTGKFGTDNLTTGTSWVSGLFFRHELPYSVTVIGSPKGGGSKTANQYAVTSPDESETNFFPVNRSFFANNQANITITDGVLTGVDQTTQSEVAAAVGIPASWISSYTTAIGQLLSGLTSISGDQQKLLQQLQATALTQSQSALIQYQSNAAAAAQFQVCLKTVASYPSPTSLTDATNALEAIKAACPGS
jgi:hypothetical protein